MKKCLIALILTVFPLIAMEDDPYGRNPTPSEEAVHIYQRHLDSLENEWRSAQEELAKNQEMLDRMRTSFEPEIANAKARLERARQELDRAREH